MMKPADRLNEFAARYTEAWCSQQATRVASFFTHGGVLFVNGSPAVGREAITAVVQEFMSAFPDMKLIMDELDTQSEQPIYHWTFLGTNTGPDGTGNAVRFSGHEKWTIAKEGLIIESQGHFDNDDYQYQLKHGYSTQ